MELLVYEYTSATGLDEKLVQPSVLSEGFGMLRALCIDATAAGIHVTTILNDRITGFNPPLNAEHKISVHSKIDAERVFAEKAANMDAALVVAPETNGILQKLVEKTEQSDVSSLNSSAIAISLVSDKAFLPLYAKSLGLRAPETITINAEDNLADVIRLICEEIGFPAIVKSVRDAGCGTLNIIKNREQAEKAIKELAAYSNNRFVAQELVQGIPASVSLLSNGTEAQPLTLNEQHILLKPPNQGSDYIGGTTPFMHKQRERAYRASKRLVESIKGLRGYVGVDLILTEDEPIMIEINPRLTTSYIGIQKILKLNLLQTIINASLEHELPANLETAGHTYFGKVKTPNPTITSLQETYRMPELISSPFPTKNNDFAYAFICTRSSTPKKAKHEFINAKKQLHKILLPGGSIER